MGKVRPDYIKRVSRELLQRFPEAFTVNFEANKKVLPKYANIQSKRVRNRVAGYIVDLLKIKSHESVVAD